VAGFGRAADATALSGPAKAAGYRVSPRR